MNEIANLYELTDEQLAALYIEKTEQLAKGHGVLERMETGYGRLTVLHEMGALENEIGAIVGEMDRREEGDRP